MYVLDTNTAIYFFKGQGHVADHLLATPPSEVAIPAIVVYELETGIAKSGSSRRRKQLRELLKVVSILPFGAAEARVAAEIRARLEAEGQTIGPMDLLIAATAVQVRGTLVTRNLREFRRIDELALVDWYHQPP